MWDLLDLILIVMGYPRAQTGGGDVEMALLELSENWATLGMPGELSAEDALRTVEALGELELLLLLDPEQTPLLVRLQTLATIASMREALTSRLLSVGVIGGGA